MGPVKQSGCLRKSGIISLQHSKHGSALHNDVEAFHSTSFSPYYQNYNTHSLQSWPDGVCCHHSTRYLERSHNLFSSITTHTSAMPCRIAGLSSVSPSVILNSVAGWYKAGWTMLASLTPCGMELEGALTAKMRPCRLLSVDTKNGLLTSLTT